MEDLRQIQDDRGLRDLVRLSAMPSADATGDWLRRMGQQSGLARLSAVNQRLIRRALNHDSTTDYTLDIDATQIVAEKRDAKWTYKGERGYMPIVGHLAENGLVLGDEFREGNEAPAARNLDFIQACAAQMPTGKRLAHLRADSATYQAAVFNWCEEHHLTFAIGGVLDPVVKGLIATMPSEAWRPHENGHIVVRPRGSRQAETIHCMNKTRKAFRRIVIRRPVQQELFSAETPQTRYTVIASNREESAEATVRWYNRRGETSENRIKELKIGFGLERLPCGTLEANAMFFRIGVLAYNLFVLFKLLALPNAWRTAQIQTIRWRLYQIAGKVVTHAGAVILKVQEGILAVFDEIRTRCAEVARA